MLMIPMMNFVCWLLIRYIPICVVKPQLIMFFIAVVLTVSVAEIEQIWRLLGDWLISYL